MQIAPSLRQMINDRTIPDKMPLTIMAIRPRCDRLTEWIKLRPFGGNSSILHEERRQTKLDQPYHIYQIKCTMGELREHLKTTHISQSIFSNMALINTRTSKL